MTQYIYPNKAWAEPNRELCNLFKKQSLQIGLSEPRAVRFEENDCLILDFGVELCGGIRILAHEAENTLIRIRFGESLTECYSEVGGETNATNDHSLRDFTVHLQNFSDMTFGQSGFRFARIDFGGTATIKSIVAESKILKKKAVYVYSGNDKRVREIYDAAKRTVDLCASSGYVWDGIKRDRLVWIGDMAPEVLALSTLYGRLPCIERSLDFSKSMFPLPKWMNNMPAYSMWWIIILSDYYKKTGTVDFVKKQLEYLTNLLKQMDSCVADDGTLNYPSYFVDWPTHGQPDELAGVRAINIFAVKRAIWLLHEFKKDTLEAEALLQKLLKQKIEVGASKQVLGLKHFATELTEEDRNKLLADGAKGMSTFMSYYILKAIASFDREAAIQIMKEYYGAMLDKGATTFWEDFDIQWATNSCRIDEIPRDGEWDIHGDFGAFCYVGHRHSLCHGWSAGVIAFMEEEGL